MSLILGVKKTRSCTQQWPGKIINEMSRPFWGVGSVAFLTGGFRALALKICHRVWHFGLGIRIDWAAVKELRLCYPNGCVYTYIYIK